MPSTQESLAVRARFRTFDERTDPTTGERYRAIRVRGAQLRDDPVLNKGTCFTLEERDALGLRGILPPAVSSPAEQEARAYENYRKASDDIGRYLFLAALQDRNETLFYRLLLDHLEEMVPIVYTPTVGRVCEHFSHIYRRPRGLYISRADRGRMAQVLKNADREPRVIVITDNEAILGIGDQGVGGMGIAIGKLALYTAGAGLHPAAGLPLDFDIGTNNPALLQDPLYLGARHPRLSGEEYFALLDELVGAISEVFPHTLVQWEDFANERAFEVMNRYRNTLPTFDDDIQGTGAVVEAGVRVALGQVGRRLADERVVFFGAGASGAGCAMQLRRAMAAEGVPQAELARRVVNLDSQGLILADRPGLSGHKKEIAADPSLVAGWKPGPAGRFDLASVVAQFRPTVLIGASGQPSAFKEEIIRTMHASCARPIVLPISNPTSKIEARPEDLLRWTNGAAVVGTGSPFPPVELNGVRHVIGQGNNAFVFPGLGLGASAVEARWLPDEVFAAAAKALYDFTDKSGKPGAAIYPAVSQMRSVSRQVAVAVGRALVAAGAAPVLTDREVEERVDTAMWDPVYVPYRPTPALD